MLKFQDIDFQFPPNGGLNAVYPYKQLLALREQGRVVWNETMNGWMVTRYDDIKKILTDAKTFSNEDGGIKEAFGEHAMLFIDTLSMHNNLRAVWARETSAIEIEKRYGLFYALADSLLDPAIERLGAGESVEIVTIIKDFTIDAITTLMDLPSDRREDFKRWNNIISESATIQIPKDDPRFIRRAETKKEVFAFLDVALQDRFRRIAAGEEPDDLVSMMVMAEGRKGITPPIILDNLLNLFLGAYDTTVRWLGNILSVLSRNPQLLQELLANPALRPQAYEEILRYECVVQVIARRARADTQVGGQAISAGQEVFMMLGIGNRDSDVFENPEELDIHRPPQMHLGFGFGIHQCLGLHTARVEVRAFMDRFLESISHIDIVEADYGPNWTLWGPLALEIRAASGMRDRGPAAGAQ